MKKPPTGEPYAGKPPVRFGGRGRRKPIPTPIITPGSGLATIGPSGLGRVLINRGSWVRLDPCPLSGELQTETGHRLRSEKGQKRSTQPGAMFASFRPQ